MQRKRPAKTGPDGGTIDVKSDKNAIQKAGICQETFEMSPGFLGQGPQMVPVVHCVDLDKGLGT